MNGRATLSFRLPEETQEHMAALKAGELVGALREVDQHLRKALKYGDHSDEVRAALQEVRDLLPHELMSMLE